tara:strand:- start:153 stop:479 length:327 start_codon:yes stop_codon:yes gene_type:complete
MLNVGILLGLLGSLIGSYLFANLFAWLIKLITPWDYNRRFVIGGLITIVVGGILNAYGNGADGAASRLSVVTEYGHLFIWTQFYGVMAMMGLYFTIGTLLRSDNDGSE